MVCSADELVEWRDFPKGLRVLLLDEDSQCAEEIKSKLEKMEYIVSTFYDENEALAALSSTAENFHVAIVEVNTGANHGSYKFLETARDLPTIMVSNIRCLSTMMKCIALGAAEFLQKPLSEDKLKNIWQHVVHKAFNAGGDLSKSLKPLKETVASMLQLPANEAEHLSLKPLKTEQTCSPSAENEVKPKPLVMNERFPAPSTPQLEQGERVADQGDGHELPNSSEEKETIAKDGLFSKLEKQSFSESKSVENTCDKSVCLDAPAPEENSSLGPIIGAEEEVDSAEGSKLEEGESTNHSTMSCHSRKGEKGECTSPSKRKKGIAVPPNPCNSSRKKMKVDWTPELHRRFVQAVEQLGIDQAIPSRILELMKVEGLTRHNVASHLQKYRIHRRHVLPKEDLGGRRNWVHREPLPRAYTNKPLIALPPLQPSGCPPPLFPVWGHPSNYATTSSIHGWGPTWQPRVHADAWGCPVLPMPGSCVYYPQNNASSCFGVDHGNDSGSDAWKNFLDLHPAESVIDEVVKEAISKPWLPLPLGLNPPSTDSVLSELQRQGITSIPPPPPPPPPHHRRHHHNHNT
ncbi:hypothetical protein AMTRI_Chr13g115240 [Amborella trichopoda]|uniref:Two-component response regulator-like APRR2 n=1 Tax=Amborella trichopoda TaxID=13333 RepID=W1PMH7_AMBTC|nr:two-component response regulator-like APRR2 [Amborella trichopoda]XP_011624556.1 two-component response regulator-like APRR2 [Amborella trichopoda]XP_011624557.1 two-component response regulator-like APRR2 [Amborella trichopoda]XP_020524836.1 two-component response regulator-like APRR2 [Amborella trichopoda]XP_020524837.1 two-component response regulator-like APRR2 [Amborella trichopoda]XP_020524838.1 two-component response regulator-like APRR2 [Amborella trichopoda]XP_020524839.1 two-comp|eukprot:XP_006847667.1 two-component response regulator-like APRR2 [Amborella trichopoda]